jgi:hypothetical protein
MELETTAMPDQPRFHGWMDFNTEANINNLRISTLMIFHLHISSRPGGQGYICSVASYILSNNHLCLLPKYACMF